MSTKTLLCTLFLAVSLILAHPLIAEPRQGILTSYGALTIACRPVGQAGKTEGGESQEGQLTFALDGKIVAQGSDCRSSRDASLFPFWLGNSKDGAPAIFNDAFFTDAIFVPMSTDDTAYFLLLHVESSTSARALRWPQVLKPLGVRYNNRDLVEISFAIDWLRMPPAFMPFKAANPSCTMTINWADITNRSMRTESASKDPQMQNFCAQQFGTIFEMIGE